MSYLVQHHQKSEVTLGSWILKWVARHMFEAGDKLVKQRIENKFTICWGCVGYWRKIRWLSSCGLL